MTAPRWTSERTGSVVYEADARSIASQMPAGCASLAILDGPYGMGKAAWDRVPRGGSLADLYSGHLDDVGRVCGESASLYLWNTSAGWAELHPHILARGWTFRSLIVWDKITPASMLGWGSARSPIDTTEVCGLYGRGDWQWMPDPACKGNVWAYGMSALARDMIRTGRKVPHRGCEGAVAEALHPSQKPLLFAERMISASSRPGDVVWVPFGGTLRELVANERIGHRPGAGRKVVTCEINADGVDYIGAALQDITGRPSSPGQLSLLGVT